LIGVFDSGVGGLSVLREIQTLLPEHSITYLADQAWAPYGERRLEEVRRRSVAITDRLLAEGAATVVVACNSASAAALHHLREVYPGVPFVGMEPAVKPAAELTANGVIGVLATDATFQGELYASVVNRHAVGVEIVARPGRGLVRHVESGDVDSPELRTLLASYLDPMVEAGADTIVLGCTHYPFLLPLIRSVAGSGVRVIDPAPAVARQVARVAKPVPQGAPGLRFATTGSPVVLAVMIEKLLGYEPEALPEFWKIGRLPAPGSLPTPEDPA
jgi:glutamate racemase